MKKLFASALFALLGTGAFAQTSQGTVVLSGSLGIKSIDREHGTVYKGKSFNIGPSMGYFVKDNLVVGMGLNYLRETSESTEIIYGGYNSSVIAVESTTNGFYITPYISKYFSLTDKIFLSGRGSISYGKSKIKTEYGSDTQSMVNNNSSFRAGVSPGISFFPTSKFGLSASFGFLGYTQSKNEFENVQTNDYKTSEFGLDFNSSSLNFGLSYYISR